MTIKPGMSSILGTTAQLVNSIPAVFESRPGLKTVADLPVSAAWLGGPPGSAFTSPRPEEQLCGSLTPLAVLFKVGWR